MGWMSDNDLRPGVSGFYPANEYKERTMSEPKGTLTVSVEVMAFDPAADMYRRLNHGLVQRNVSFIEGMECTKAEAEALVDKLRKANPNHHLVAGWTGASVL